MTAAPTLLPPSRGGAAPDATPRLVTLAGGVGAARFLRGLVRTVDPAMITVIVNTADDISRHGLWVSPDIDSVIYTLAGLNDEDRGWGLRDETWSARAALAALGEETWFQLGDRDLATHIWRSHRRRSGESLSKVTETQRRRLGVPVQVLPMSDDVVTTRVTCTDLGELHIQEYFVRERCQPAIESIRYSGVERARPAPGVLEAIAAASAVIVCPSNPVMSIAPILAVPGIREALRAVPQGIAVTPIVAGTALKGPAAVMLVQQGIEVSAAGVAGLYADFCQTMVVDRRDAAVVPAVEQLGTRALLAETVMDSIDAAATLAAGVRDALGLDWHRGVAA